MAHRKSRSAEKRHLQSPWCQGFHLHQMKEVVPHVVQTAVISNPGASVRDVVPAVSVVRTRTQSRPRPQPQAAGSDGTSTPSPSPQPAPSLSSQEATFLVGAAIQTAHQASHMASSAASSALQGHQAAVFARAREWQTEEQAYQVVGHVRSEAHQVVDHARLDPRPVPSANMLLRKPKPKQPASSRT